MSEKFQERDKDHCPKCEGSGYLCGNPLAMDSGECDGLDCEECLQVIECENCGGTGVPVPPSPSVDEVRADLLRLLDAVVWTGCPCGKPHIAKSLVENKGTIIGLYKKYRGA